MIDDSTMRKFVQRHQVLCSLGTIRRSIDAECAISQLHALYLADCFFNVSSAMILLCFYNCHIYHMSRISSLSLNTIRVELVSLIFGKGSSSFFCPTFCFYFISLICSCSVMIACCLHSKSTCVFLSHSVIALNMCCHSTVAIFGSR